MKKIVTTEKNKRRRKNLMSQKKGQLNEEFIIITPNGNWKRRKNRITIKPTYSGKYYVIKW